MGRTNATLTSKQEKFCLLVAEGKSQADAYRGSYDAKNMADKTIWEKASVLMSEDKVRSRVQELRDMAAEKTGVTIESITKELDAQIALASQEKQHSASLSGIKTKAELHGLMVKKTEHSGKVEWEVVKYDDDN